MEISFGVQQGWQCPICKRVYSPTTMMCMYCGNTELATTIGDVQPVVNMPNIINDTSMTQEELEELKEKSSARVLDKKKLDSLFSEESNELHIEKSRGFQAKSISDKQTSIRFN